MKGRFRLNIRYPEIHQRDIEVSARYRESPTRTRVSDSSSFRCHPARRKPIATLSMDEPRWGWLIYSYRATTDKPTGIVNDTNEWFADPRPGHYHRADRLPKRRECADRGHPTGS